MWALQEFVTPKNLSWLSVPFRGTFAVASTSSETQDTRTILFRRSMNGPLTNFSLLFKITGAIVGATVAGCIILILILFLVHKFKILRKIR